MKLTRRSVLQGALATAATVSTGAGVVLVSPPHALLVYDSRLPQSRAFERRHAGRTLDVAYECAHRWRNLRNLEMKVPVVGLTTWSALVQVRSLLQERGGRIRVETRCGRLFYWELA